MANEVNQLPLLPRKDSSSSEDSPPAVPFPSLEEENTMTQDNLDYLRELCFILSSIQVRLLEAGKIIGSNRPDEVAFY